MGLLSKLFGKKEKPRDERPDFSNVRSGSSSTAPTAPAATSGPGVGTPADATEATPPPAVGRTYEVKQGDTLSGIAQELYGDAGRWREIHEANRSEVPDPDKIYPGQVLRIPS